jgi:murein DD-endopeptidase MepM/ murein hydrolase activator NlpD
VTDGVVQELSRTDSWNSRVNSGDTRGGLFVSVVGDDGVRYYGSHLREVDAALSPGVRVRRGQRLGAVGDTGDAKGVGCHLHFGLSAPCGPGDWQRRRGEVWPQKYLDAWRTASPASPAPEIAARRC